MLRKIDIEFPQKQLDNSITNVINILTSVKPLTKKIITDESLNLAIRKCIEVFQVLLAHTTSMNEDWRDEMEAKTREARELRQKYRNRTITDEELARLNELENEGY
jgi:hypothetical protein